jgi:hypothetical protein
LCWGPMLIVKRSFTSLFWNNKKMEINRIQGSLRHVSKFFSFSVFIWVMRESNLQWDIFMYICVLSLANFTKNGIVRSTWKDDFICCTHVMSVVFNALKMWLVLQEMATLLLYIVADDTAWFAWSCFMWIQLKVCFFYFNMLIKNTSSNQINWFWIIVMSLPLSALVMGLPASSL